jgi:hypothetical protein
MKVMQIEGGNFNLHDSASVLSGEWFFVAGRAG